jgi:DNA-binding MarR family transcriptional regulator/predicted GNAT family N-acyltransferase
MFLHTQAELALGSRFKMLSEALYTIANQVYGSLGVELDAHAFPVLRYLQVKGAATVTEIAQGIGQTHSAVSQMAAKLKREDWLTHKADRADGRRRLLELSADGESRLGQLGPVWRAIRRGAKAAADRSTGSLLDALARFEADIASGRMLREILAAHVRISTAKVQIKPFRPVLREHFERINAEWLERDFAIEAIDRAVLSQPEQHVLKPGGAILYAVLDGEVIGTAALLKEGPGVYELSKMAVETGFRGLGAGRLLLDAAIAEFGRRAGKILFLESSKKLTPALTMYESAGFVHHPAPRPGSHYQRSDVYMIYAAKARKRAKDSASKRRSTAAAGES